MRTVQFLRQRRFWDLLIASFGALFFEMLLVRWLPTTIYYLGYYKNSILFATFLGFGCGAATRRRVDRLIPFFLLLVAATVLAAQETERYTRIAPVATGEFLWPQAKTAPVAMPILILLLGVFAASALLMIPLGRLVGRNLEAFPPNEAYSINIVASLIGVLFFLVLSYLGFGPLVWFAVAAVPVLYFVRSNTLGLVCGVAGLVLTLGILQFFRSPEEYWSPYSKISLEEPNPLINARMLSTNNNGHQVLYDLSADRLAGHTPNENGLWQIAWRHQFLYDSAYSIIAPKSVLIIGGGTGNEAAAALRRGVERVDVIEIDPVIINIGKKYHPEQPYADPRVHVINDDARHYMATTPERYDLVIFGFLDSTSHLSSMSNIRLDNYVYTLESFRQARALLQPGGLLQVTYYALADFVRLRIFLMLHEAFDQAPVMTQIKNSPSPDVVFFAGPAVANRVKVSLPEFVQTTYDHDSSSEQRQLLSATDDWPYLNLQERRIGRDYILALGLMFAMSVVFIGFFVWSSGMAQAKTAPAIWFFLQGAGFMLLETTAITRMALIMGSTWVVTSMAVILVLLAAFISNMVVRRFAFPSVHAAIAILAATVLLNYGVDIHYYLAVAGPLRALVAALPVYLPILASSLIFARLFQGSDQSSFDFGMNILGAVFGGMLEYVSLIVGIRTLYLVALVLFLALAALINRSAAYVLRADRNREPTLVPE